MPSKKRGNRRGYNYRGNNFGKRKRKTTRACGWYECDECGEHWESVTQIFTDTEEACKPQTCNECDFSVYPYKILRITKKNKRKVLERVYGEFECDQCGEYWESQEVLIVRGTLVVWNTEDFSCCGHPVEPFNVLRVTNERKQLERVLGHFQCESSTCDHEWISAYAWVVRGTSVGWHRQACIQCHGFVYPDSVETILCAECQVKPCICDRSEEEEKKPHVKHLCEKCRNLGVSCSGKRGYGGDSKDGGDEPAFAQNEEEEYFYHDDYGDDDGDY